MVEIFSSAIKLFMNPYDMNHMSMNTSCMKGDDRMDINKILNKPSPVNTSSGNSSGANTLPTTNTLPTDTVSPANTSTNTGGDAEATRLEVERLAKIENDRVLRLAEEAWLERVKESRERYLAARARDQSEPDWFTGPVDRYGRTHSRYNHEVEIDSFESVKQFLNLHRSPENTASDETVDRCMDSTQEVIREIRKGNFVRRCLNFRVT